MRSKPLHHSKTSQTACNYGWMQAVVTLVSKNRTMTFKEFSAPVIEVMHL